MRYQRTIQRPISCTGIGLHTGASVSFRLRPAPEGHGIVFRRADLPRSSAIRASAEQVISSRLSTSLGVGRATVQTVEHLLAACAGLRIDNVMVEVDGPEIPILDGSAEPFVRLLRKAGIWPQAALQPYLRLIRPLVVGEEGRGITLHPTPFPKISCAIDFSSNVVPHQAYDYHCTEDEFVRQIAPARTFGFLKDVEAIRAAGLIKGGSLDNAVVIGEQGVLNPGGLRFPDEFVRHKVLDMIGDLSLAGYPLVAHVVAACAGHTMNVDVVNHLLSHPDAWVLVTPDHQQDEVAAGASPRLAPASALLPL